MSNYYRKKEDPCADTIYFEKVKEEDIKICGLTIEEIINILSGLKMERIKGIEMTMKNLKEYRELLEKEMYESFNRSLKGGFDNMLNCFKIPTEFERDEVNEYDHS